MKMMIVIGVIICMIGCKGDDINDSSKRNSNWAWWVDAKTGKGQWIPIANETTVKTGSLTTFYFNGNVYEKGKLKDGKYVDTVFTYTLQGKLFTYYFPKSDSVYYLNDGPVINLRSDGSKYSEGIVRNHAYGDRWIAYYKSGNKKWEHDYSKGDTGWQVHYYENGQVKDSAFHLNDLSWGNKCYIIKTWYENGVVAEIRNWKDHVKNGLGLSFYGNGQMKDSAMLVNGKAEGIAKHWNENGNLEIYSEVKYGQPSGLCKMYYETGEIRALTFIKDKKLVNGTFYDKKGNITKTVKDGNVVK